MRLMNTTHDSPKVIAPPQIERLQAKLLPDNQRVRVTLVLNNVECRPTLELSLLDDKQIEIARSTIIGTFNTLVSFTLHLGQHSPNDRFFLQAVVFPNDNEFSDSKKVRVEVGSR
jgi:hypothetical protein